MTKSKLGREDYMAYKSRLEFIIAGNSKQELEATNSLKSKNRERKKKCMCDHYCSVHFFYYTVLSTFRLGFPKSGKATKTIAHRYAHRPI